jgi:hypothetical protein
MEFAKLLVAEVLAQVEELETQLRMSAFVQAISLTLMRLLNSVKAQVQAGEFVQGAKRKT